MRLLSARAILFTSAAIATFATPAFAQDNAATSQQLPERGKDTGADNGADSETSTIVVTARRVTEPLQKVPAAISAFDSKALERLQAKDLTDLEGAVPNLNIVQGRGSSNATNIFIRGIGQPDALQTFDPAIGVYIDDVYLSRIRGAQLDMLDVDQIEVLRGPQGTLYGKNTIGGAIKYITHKPGQELWAKGEIDAGSHDEITAKGALSGPLSSILSVGIAAMYSKHDGYVEDYALDRDYNDKNTTAVRGAIAFTPSSKLRVDLSADYTHDDAELNVGRPVNDLTTFSGGTLVVTNPVGSGEYDWKGRTSPGLPNSTKLTHYGFSGTVAYNVNDQLTLKSITAYRNLATDDYIDIDATQYQVGDVFVGVRQNQFSQEFQATYTSDRLSGVAGLYYLDEHIKSHQEAYADDLLGPLYLNSGFLRTIDDRLETKSYAAYANGSFEIVPNVHLSAGIRYTEETKDYWRTTSTFFSLLSAFNSTYVYAPAQGKWHDWSPMGSVDWQISPSTMLYAKVAKGFKSGGFNGRANSALESSAYDPEKVWSYEAGFKTLVLNQLRLNGDVFTSDYSDFQARVGDTDSTTVPPTPLLTVLNVGKMRISGAELEASWTPVRGLLLDGQVGYLDAKYKEFADNRFPNGSRAFQTPAFAPKWTMRYGAQYAFDAGNAGTFTLGGQARYKSRTALAVDNTYITYAYGGASGVGTTTEVPGLFQDDYWLFDARFVWEDPSKRFSIGLYGQNLGDKAYKTDAQEFSSVGNIRTVYYGAPRTFTVRLTARY